MKIKIFTALILSFFLFVFKGSFLTASAQAAKLYLDPSSKNTTVNTDFDVYVGIDTENAKVTGAVIVLSYLVAKLR
jgi:hypothetical protein